MHIYSHLNYSSYWNTFRFDLIDLYCRCNQNEANDEEHVVFVYAEV
jgi:hypothetical protein